jgi:beta-glucosidase
VTINEPNVYVYSGYVEGVFPPGMKDIELAPALSSNLLKAHAAGYEAIHDLQPEAEVGIAHHYRSFQPSDPRNPLDRIVTRFRHHGFNNVFPEAIKSGKMRMLHWHESMPEIKDTQDFFGLNYYTRESVDVDLRNPGEILRTGGFPEGADISPTGFIANEPDGFWEALRWAHGYDLPIYITENGIEDPEDRIRSRFLAGHIHTLWRAANFNWKIKGYYHWTLVDNFEWERGWTQRFGLWEMDPKTQVRKKRRAADFFAEICKENGLTSGAVAEYAPEVLDELFPPRQPDDLRI